MKKPQTTATAELLHTGEKLRLDLLTGILQPAEGPEEEFPSEALRQMDNRFAVLDDRAGGEPCGWLMAKMWDGTDGTYRGQDILILTAKSTRAIQQAEAALDCARCGAAQGEVRAHQKETER